MSVEKEADLFININSKQKSVPRGLLVSLLADIRMGDSDPSTALSALASGVQRMLDQDETGPLAGRFAKHGMPPEPRQNLTVAETVKGLASLRPYRETGWKDACAGSAFRNYG